MGLRIDHLEHVPKEQRWKFSLMEKIGKTYHEPRNEPIVKLHIEEFGKKITILGVYSPNDGNIVLEI